MSFARGRDATRSGKSTPHSRVCRDNMLGAGDVKIAAVDLARSLPQHEYFDGIATRHGLTVSSDCLPARGKHDTAMRLH
jgi:hypothetical protein